MFPILYEKNESDFTTLGLGILTDCTQCDTNEVVNAKNEATFSYPSSGRLYEKITPDRIVKVKANEYQQPQLFRIYRSSKPINGIVKFYCQHISYDLNMLIVRPFGDLLNVNATTALNRVLENTVYEHNFTAESDIAGTKNIVSSIPQSVRKWLGTDDGAILNLYGGEYEFDNFIIRLKQNRGSNKGVRIAYGKNLKSITADTDIQGTYTSIYPYAIDSSGNYIELSEKIIELSNASQYGEKRTLTLDVSNMFEKGEIITPSKIQAKALQYVNENGIDQISQNIKVDFVHLWQSKEYESVAALERVNLGDYVTIEYRELGVNATAEVISYQYDCLSERYTQLELGDVKPNMAATLNKVNKIEQEVVKETSERQKAIDQATSLITGGLGGFVVIEPNENTGYPEEILIMDTNSKATATNVIRLNKNGIGFSTNGYNGPFSTAWTIDGKFNASWITTGILNADLLRTGTITDQTGTTSINLANGNVKIKQANGGQISIYSQGIYAENAEGKTVARLFVTSDGKGALEVDTVSIGEVGTGTIITSDFFEFNGRGYYPRQITVDDTTYTVLASIL
jgi:phage minor structural protein